MIYNPTLHKLSNGVTVILDKMDGASTTRIIVQFETGANDENESQRGLTHFCEHMLCSGTTRLPSAYELEHEITDNGGRINPMTSGDYLQFGGKIIAENANILLNNISDRLQNSLFDPKTLENERGVIRDELMRDGNSKKQSMLNAILPGYSVETLGTEQNINSFTAGQMRDWLSRRLSAKNCVICISGKIDDKQKMLSDLEKMYSFLPATDVTHRCADITNFAPTTIHQPDTNSRNTGVNIFMPYTYKNQTGTARQFEEMCLQKQTAYIRRQLMRVLRTENGLCYDVSIQSYGTDSKQFLCLNTESQPQNLKRVVALAAQTVYDSLHNNVITDEFLRSRERAAMLSDAEWFESSEFRCTELVMHYFKWHELRDRYAAINMARNITAHQVIETTRGLGDGAVAIYTTGPEYNLDLQKIWHDNFTTPTKDFAKGRRNVAMYAMSNMKSDILTTTQKTTEK